MSQQEEKNKLIESLIINDFVKELEQTAQQVKDLLNELRDSKIDAATIRLELKFVVENVKELSSIIKDGDKNGAVLTRLALLEQSVNYIKEYVEKDSSAGNELNTRVALLEQTIESLLSKKEAISKKPAPEGKWKLYIAIAGGIFTLLGTIAAAILQYYFNFY
jgi:uncharacterized protein involved in exopolysaccharide biosynthesis